MRRKSAAPAVAVACFSEKQGGLYVTESACEKFSVD